MTTAPLKPATPTRRYACIRLAYPSELMAARTPDSDRERISRVLLRESLAFGAWHPTSLETV
jgi:hypothetical protein